MVCLKNGIRPLTVCGLCHGILRASSPGHSGGRAGKGRKLATMSLKFEHSASKKSMRNVDWQRWH